MATADTPNGPRPLAPVQGIRPSTAAVAGAIRKASQSTGASFEYLLATAKVESDLNPNLTMRSSTATGLFQFLEQTWLGVMQSAGRAFGYGQYADAITQTKSGTYVVEDSALRDEMMKLRKDPAVNAAMGGVFSQQNAAIVSKRIGRKPTDGELYVAHFFGPYAGSKVIGMAKSNPTANAVEMFPAAAAANRPIFYDKQGNARSVAGVYNELVRRYQVARARPTPGLDSAVASAPVAAPTAATTTASTQTLRTVRQASVAAAPAPVRDTAGITEAFAAANVQPPRPTANVQPPRPLSDAQAVPDAVARTAAAASFLPATRAPSSSAFHSLFETDGPRGAISPAVAELWGLPGRERDLPSAAASFAPTDPEAMSLSPPGLSTTGPSPTGPGAPLDLTPPSLRRNGRG